MDPDSLKTYLEKLEEYVLEENKIVTYKWLTRILKIHVNTAKQLLYSFVCNQETMKANSLSVMYLLAGALKEGGQSVTVVDKKYVDKARSLFTNISSEHVYSVSKIKSPDFQLLYVTDKYPDNMNITRLAPISCSSCVVRSGSELEDSRIKHNSPAKQAKPDTKLDEKKKDTIFTSKPVNLKSKEMKENREEKIVNNKTSPKKGSPKKENKTSLAAMFAAQGNRNKKVSSTDSTSKSTKQTSTVLASGENELNQDKIKNGLSIETKETVADKSPEKVKTGSGKKSKPKNESAKGKRKSKKEPELEKKRKRIQVFSDSEDSEEEDISIERDVEPEPEPEPEPEVNQLKSDEESIQAEDTSQNKKRKKKIVDKHVMNADGFMETTKEVLYVTDSEEDEEKPPKRKSESPKKTNQPIKKSLSPKKTQSKKESTEQIKKKLKTTNLTKQPTLTSFFKKK